MNNHVSFGDIVTIRLSNDDFYFSCPGFVKTDIALKKIKELVGIARVEPASKIYIIGSELGGRVIRIMVKEGESVKKGQLLIELDASTEDAQINQSNTKEIITWLSVS